MLSFLKPKKKFILTENNKKRIEKGKTQYHINLFRNYQKLRH